jgi:hypothetical protein
MHVCIGVLYPYQDFPQHEQQVRIGRLPTPPWPDDPLKAPATRRAKPRGT